MVRTPLGRCARLAESARNRPSVRVVIASCSRWIISVRTWLVGVEMGKRRYGVRVASKVGGREVCMITGRRGAGERNFRASVETSSTSVVYGKGMRVTTVTRVSV